MRAMRTITEHPATARTIDVAEVDDVRAWLEGAAHDYGLQWLLAHADDGIIWGRFVHDASGVRLVTHPPRPTVKGVTLPTPPALQRDTLQTARLFAPGAEVLLWRDDDDTWRARGGEVLGAKDPRPPGVAHFNEAFDEAHILWGNRAQRLDPVDGVPFTAMEDGAQGLRYVVPLGPRGVPPDTGTNARRLRLCVRHYIAQNRADDATPGLTRVALSRLCDLYDMDERGR